MQYEQQFIALYFCNLSIDNTFSNTNFHRATNNLYLQIRFRYLINLTINILNHLYEPCLQQLLPISTILIDKKYIFLIGLYLSYLLWIHNLKQFNKDYAINRTKPVYLKDIRLSYMRLEKRFEISRESCHTCSKNGSILYPSEPLISQQILFIFLCILQMQRLQRSRQTSSRRTSPDHTITQSSQLQTSKLDKSRYTEITISTQDEDVPFIALYKPNLHKQKTQLQAASKIHHVFASIKQRRAIHVLGKFLALGPKEKLTNLRILHLSSCVQKAAARQKQKGWGALVGNVTKKKGREMAVKMMSRVESSIRLSKIRHGLVQLRRNRLLFKIQQITDSNELAKQLDSLRAQLFKLNGECYSQELIAATRLLNKNTNNYSLLTSLQEAHYPQILKKESKRYEQLRYNSSPRLKEFLNNEVIISLTANIIAAGKATTQKYEAYCQQLQNELSSYKDVEGINQLKQVIREKDRVIREIQSFVGEISRMDIQLKKFTAQSRFNLEKVSSTLKSQDKKLQAKTKSLQQTSNKIALSRSYLSSVMNTLLKKIEETEKNRKEAQLERRNQEQSQAGELQQYRRQLDLIKTELEQQRSKIILVKQKKDTVRALQDLKRRWKGNQDLKSLVQFMVSLHQKIQELQRNQRQVTGEQNNMVSGIQFIKDYINKGIEQIQQELPLPSPQKKQHLPQGLSEIFERIQTTLQIASRRYKYSHEKFEKSQIFESDVKSIKRPVGPGLELDEHENLIAKQLFSQIKSTEKEIQRYHQHSSQSILNKIDRQSALVIEQLKTSILGLQNHIQQQTSIAEEQKEAIKTVLAKLEEVIKILNSYQASIQSLHSQNSSLEAHLLQSKENYQLQISTLQKQIIENNRLIQQLTFKNAPISSKEPSKIIPPNKNNQHLLSQQIEIQQQLIRLKSQHEEELAQHRNEFVKWKEQNTGLWQKIVSLEDQLRLTHKRQVHEARVPQGTQLPSPQKESFLAEKVILEEMRSKFLDLQKKMLQIRLSNVREEDSSRVDELMRLLHQSQSKVSQLSIRNGEMLSRLQQTRDEYQRQINTLQSQLNKKSNIIEHQQRPAVTSTSQRDQQTLQNKNFQLQEEIIKLKAQYEISYRQEINELKKFKEESLLLRNKVIQIETLLSRKNKDLEKIQNRLKQTDNNLAAEREKVSNLRLQIANLQKELGRSHSQTDKLALEAREEVRKITMVIRSLEQELDKKVKECQVLQQESNEKSRIMAQLQRESKSYQGQMKEIMVNFNQVSEKNEILSSELTHLKAEFYSIQVQIQSQKNSKVDTNERLLSLQNQIKGKQDTIVNILSHSKAASDNLNQQLFEAREEILTKERHFEEQLSVKNVLINRLQHKIIELQNSLRTTEQKCFILQQSSHKRQNESSPHPRDREIQLLQQQIASLQQFLGDLSHEYKQLQAKYHQQKHRFGRFYDNSQKQRSMEQIDKAIHDLADSSELSEEVKSLIVNNEKLQIDLEQLEEQRRKLLEKARSQPERQYVVELLFNIILGASKVSPQSQKANNIWNQLVQINQRSTEVGQLFTSLENFSLRLLNLSS